MEDTLRARAFSSQRATQRVLILVLMEDTLRVGIKLRNGAIQSVLILVLMEDTLRVNNFSVTGYIWS